MGIGSNLMIELQEQEVKNIKYQNIINEAAHYVVNKKMPRKEAFEHSTNLHEERDDKDNYMATDEDTMEIEYLHSHLKEPKFEETKQIKAVANELFEEFES